jgi:hypothetical protein
MNKRGCKADKYVMARQGDDGPYASWNVKCITLSENSSEQKYKGLATRQTPTNAKLTPNEVVTIYGRIGNQAVKSLAREFRVSPRTIRAIRDKEHWKNVTDTLD